MDRADDQGSSTLAARLQQHERELNDASPLETVAWFLSGYCADASGMEGVRAEVASSVATHPKPIFRALEALDALLTGPPPPEGTLARLVAWDANQGIEDESDAGARAWLEQLAVLIRDVLDRAGLA
jgi:hypothetical protein